MGLSGGNHHRSHLWDEPVVRDAGAWRRSLSGDGAFRSLCGGGAGARDGHPLDTQVFCGEPQAIGMAGDAGSAFLVQQPLPFPRLQLYPLWNRNDNHISLPDSGRIDYGFPKGLPYLADLGVDCGDFHRDSFPLQLRFFAACPLRRDYSGISLGPFIRIFHCAD